MVTVIHILWVLYIVHLTYTCIFIENCESINLQLATASRIVLVKNCKRISLSVCCERLIMEYSIMAHLTIRSCCQVLLYVYTPSNPLILASSHIIVSPYNIPRPNLIAKLVRNDLVGRNCWDYGIDVFYGYCLLSCR